MGEEGEINWVSTSLSMKQELESRSVIRRSTDVCFLKWVPMSQSAGRKY